MTHTPGPFWAEGPDEFGDYNILHKGNSLAVAAVVSNMRPPGTVKANADLLAAAPDLLEALEALADEVQGVTSGDRLTRIEACRNARTAIAQAKGE